MFVWKKEINIKKKEKRSILALLDVVYYLKTVISQPLN